MLSDKVHDRQPTRVCEGHGEAQSTLGVQRVILRHTPSSIKGCFYLGVCKVW
jgi:hypothetical protein